MIIKVSHPNWLTPLTNATAIGQDLDNDDVYCIVETAPECGYEEITKKHVMPANFNIVCAAPDWIMIGNMHVVDIVGALELLEELGDNSDYINSVEDYYRYRYTQILLNK